MGSTASDIEWQRSGARLVRTAFAVPVAALLAWEFDLPLPYFAPILALLLPLLDLFSFKIAAVLLVVVALTTIGLVWLLSPFIDDRPTYLAMLFLLLFLAFRLQSNPKLAGLIALGTPMIVLMGPLVPVSSTVIGGLAAVLTALMGCAIAAIMLSWMLFPGPPGVAPATAKPAPPAPRSGIDCVISAGIMVLLIQFTLELDAQSAIRILMIASSVLLIPDHQQGWKFAIATMLATTAGIIGAGVLQLVLALMPSRLTAAMVAGLVILLVGRRLTDPRTGYVVRTGVIALWILLGADATVEASKLAEFFVYAVIGIAVAIGLRQTLLWHLDRSARPLAPLPKL